MASVIDSFVVALAGITTFTIAYVLLVVLGGSIGWALFGLYITVSYVSHRVVVYAHTGGQESVFPWRRT